LKVNPHTLELGDTIYTVDPKNVAGTVVVSQSVVVTITVTEFPASCGYETISWPTVPKIVFSNDAELPKSITGTIAIINQLSYTPPCPFSSLAVSRVSGTGTVTIGTNFDIDMNGSGDSGTFKFTASTISGVSEEQLVDVVLCGDEVITLKNANPYRITINQIQA
jgi:hypothetical protein